MEELINLFALNMGKCNSKSICPVVGNSTKVQSQDLKLTLTK